ncbi:MAG: antibiotic biosynthesis monooxygenase [Phycisphaeraceae bacterium]|nr:antibiotic biosynthesis monooxygenase [Phycisphaeraceae bacterium]
MVTVGMNYQIIPGKEKTFEDVFRAVVGAMSKMPGHSRSNLYRDAFDAQRYLIVSDWSDRAAFDAFIRSEQFRNVANWGKEQILAGRPTHEYYEKNA